MLIGVAIAAGCGLRGETSPPTQVPAAAALEPAPAWSPNQPVPSQALLQSHDRMLGTLSEIAKRSPDEHRYIGDRSLRLAKAKLESLGPSHDPSEVWSTRFHVGMQEFRLGHEQEAIGVFKQALDTLGTTALGANPANRAKLHFQLGVAYLRLAETQNCCQRYTPDSCVFPIHGDGIHQQQEASRTAIEYFTKVLLVAPPNSRVHLSARWLLNIAYMTIGEHPAQVPTEFLIAPQIFQSAVEFPRFQNVSAKVGVGTLSLAGGVVAEDFDGDGSLDLLVSTWDPHGQMQLFRNKGDGSFVDATNDAGLTGLLGGLNMVQADYDNDGDMDVLVLRGAWLGDTGHHPNSLLQNLGDGRFRDAAFSAGLAAENFPTQTAAWADYDNDGYLDLYVGNEAGNGIEAPCQLFHNNRDGTFTDVAVGAGVTNDRFAKAVVWGDVDADRLPDLYVSNIGQPNRLYRNNGDGTFRDVAAQWGVEKPIRSFPCWFWDFDNDGDLDIFVAAYTADIADVAASYLSLDTRPDSTGTPELACLYRNDGSGQFTDVAAAAGLTRHHAPMGCNFGDLDNDGFLDFYLGTGYPEYHSLMPNLMYWNRAGTRFEDVTVAGGFGSLQKGHGVAFADWDNDGDQDVFEQMGGALPGDKFIDALYENPGFGNQWLSLQLVGRRTNRSAIGARIRVRLIDQDGQTRDVFKHVNSGGSFGANSLRQTIGLGQATEIASVEILWPTSNSTQTIRGLKPNASYLVEEGAKVMPISLPRRNREPRP